MSLSELTRNKAHERRWLILGVLSFSLLVIVLDDTILNVALPEIVQQLKASNSQLQWMIDSYALVFAGLLLTMGSLGDKFGRRPALQAGFVIFGVGSTVSALTNTADQLIATRALMGVGAALIMPATLSIITNVFDATERPKAIAIWTATAGAGVALGPLIGGVLLEHFYWGSIFLVNVPIVVVGLVAGAVLIPDSSSPRAPRLDPYGAFLSIVSLTALLYAIIEGPTKGWTDGQIVLSFVIGGLALPAFFDWERRSDHPMVDINFWKNPRFSAASGALALAFFALAGTLFLLTQYFEFVLGLSALQTGVRLLAYAVPVAIVSPLAPKIVDRFGTKLVVAGGLTAVTIGLLLFRDVDQSSGFASTVCSMAIIAAGVALTMAPATGSIMGSLPLARAGVRSAVNDTTRQVGAAMGVG